MKDPTLFGINVRVDATLCDPHELWIEDANGHTARVWPAPPLVCCHCQNDDPSLLERVPHGYLCLVCSKVSPWR